MSSAGPADGPRERFRRRCPPRRAVLMRCLPPRLVLTTIVSRSLRAARSAHADACRALAEPREAPTAARASLIPFSQISAQGVQTTFHPTSPGSSLRVTPLRRALLGSKHTHVLGFRFTDAELVVAVKPAKRSSLCSGCGGRAPRYDRRRREWRHLDVCGLAVSLEYGTWRVECPRCGVTTEMVPFHGPWSLIALVFLCCSGLVVPLQHRVPDLAGLRC